MLIPRDEGICGRPSVRIVLNINESSKEKEKWDQGMVLFCKVNVIFSLTCQEKERDLSFAHGKRMLFPRMRSQYIGALCKVKRIF